MGEQKRKVYEVTHLYCEKCNIDLKCLLNGASLTLFNFDNHYTKCNKLLIKSEAKLSKVKFLDINEWYVE